MSRSQPTTPSRESSSEAAGPKRESVHVAAAVPAWTSATNPMSLSYAFMPSENESAHGLDNGTQLAAASAGQRLRRFDEEHGYDRASKLSKYFYWYVWDTVWTGLQRPLELEDLHMSPQKTQLRPLYKLFDSKRVTSMSSIHFDSDYHFEAPHAFDEEKSERESDAYCEFKHDFDKDDTIDDESANGSSKQRQSLAFDIKRSLLRVYSRYLLRITAWYSLFIASLIVMVLVFRELIQWFDTAKAKRKLWHGVAYALAVVALMLIRTWCVLRQWYFHEQIANQTRTLLMGLIFRKSLRLPMYARDSLTSGEIMNLMSTDTDRVFLMIRFVSHSVLGPVVVALVFGVMAYIYGWTALAGFVAICVVMISQAVAGRFAATNSRHYFAHNDSRVNFVKETVDGIRVTKMYAWEMPLITVLESLRNKELTALKKVFFSHCWMFGSLSTEVEVTTATMLVTYTLLGNNLTLAKAFTLYQFVAILHHPLTLASRAFGSLIAGVVSLNRMQRFFDQPEMAPLKRLSAATQQTTAVALKNVRFYHSAEAMHKDEACLKIGDSTLQIARGELVAVIGRVGSGKTTLLHTILGEKLWKPAQSHSSKAVPSEKKKSPDTLLDKKCESEKTEGISVSSKSATDWQRTVQFDRVGYVGENMLVVNESLRHNIVMDAEFDGVKYERVMAAVSLAHDCELLAGGDLTEVGQSGVTLSGGQRARVALARALYRCDDARFDMYVLDDPLSAVDNDVAAVIFDEGICQMLKGKTRIVALNSHLHLLAAFDRVIVMQSAAILADVRVAECGSDGLREVVQRTLDFDGQWHGAAQQILSSAALSTEQKNSESESEAVISSSLKCVKSAELLKDFGSSERSEEVKQECEMEMTELKAVMSITARKREAAKTATEFESLRRITKEESREKGAVAQGAFRKYIAAGGGVYVLAALIALQYLVQCVIVAGDFWFSQWASDSKRSERRPESEWRAGLCVIVAVGVCGAVLRPLCVFLFTLTASVSIHQSLIRRILSAPVSYFDATPTAIIVNRFAHDLSICDDRMPKYLTEFVFQTVRISTYLIAILVFLPFYIVPLVGIVYGVLRLRKLFITTSRELKRMDATTRTPIFGTLTQCVNTLSTVRAFGLGQFMTRCIESDIDKNTRCFYELTILNRWLTCILEFVQISQLLLVTLFCVLLIHFGLLLSPTTAALLCTYATNFGGMFQWVIRLSVEVETLFTAVERVYEMDGIPQENALPTNNEQSEEKLQVPFGAIELRKLRLRYRSDLPLVLNNVSLRIAAGTKLGVCGRTGAGKSSLMVALFRLFECEKPPSAVFIDGSDALQLSSLFEVRSALTIIPQSPVLFNGTLRFNLDPFKRFSDEKLWAILGKVRLLESFGSELSLQMEVGEKGKKLSLGQRQLVCIGRALLRQPRILLMDEATASVDSKSDALIQECLRDNFGDCTVITIAHRVQTIRGYDLIAVMDSGKILELGAPKQLLATEGSRFRQLCKETDSRK